MATYSSRAYAGGNFFRPVKEAEFHLTQTIVIPSGTALAANDVLKFFKLGPNVVPLDLTLTVDDLDTGAAITLDVGYAAEVAADVVDFFIDGATVGQAGGSVRVENGGDDPFADGVFNPIDEVIDIQLLVAVAPAGNPTTDRQITLSGTFMRHTAPPSPILSTPYNPVGTFDA